MLYKYVQPLCVRYQDHCNAFGFNPFPTNNNIWTCLQKTLENILGKGEIARYEQFLLFPKCFLKSSATKCSNVVIDWERVKSGLQGCHNLILICLSIYYMPYLFFTCPYKGDILRVFLKGAAGGWFDCLKFFSGRLKFANW